MRSTFFGLEIGRTALQAQQRALDVTGHNIANANTPGYTRQDAVTSATTPYAMPGLNKPNTPGQVGTGVQVDEIRRLRDSFIDTQIRTEAKTTGFWASNQDALKKLEVIFNEPSDAGLRTVMDQFWSGLQELSKNPESKSVRAVVSQRGIALADTFNHIDRQLTELQVDTDSNIRIKISEINNSANQVAQLNNQIILIESTGDKANDLRDKRDLLVDQLSKIVNLSTTEEKNGSLTLAISGRVLVSGKNNYAIQAVNTPPNGYAAIQWAADNTNVLIQSGTLKGLLDVRDITVNNYIGYINTLAGTLATQTNAIHRNGRTLNGVGTSNIDFFEPEPGATAKNISVSAAVLTSENNIAAAIQDGAPGDGSNALAMAQLKHSNILAGGSLDDYFRGIIGKLGVDSQEATRMVDNQGILEAELQNRRQTLSGVNLDEEMTNMIRFQHGYNAAARVVTVMDEMLDVIVNRLGTVGR
ncbi:MAG: flagellar hook-associated protein FlgK [Carboxydocellales bacterium]